LYTGRMFLVIVYAGAVVGHILVGLCGDGHGRGGLHRTSRRWTLQEVAGFGSWFSRIAGGTGNTYGITLVC
jgi:NADH:ubiquinone oxidoreductase subunit 6 (subunit J)